MLKRYLAELIGTFCIVFVPIAVAATAKLGGSETSLAIAAVASGLPVLAMIYALGPISAAHFNPAVTIGFAVAKRFPWKYVFGYVTSQLIGSLLAAGVVTLLYGSGFGTHVPLDPTNYVRNIGTEIMITALLMLVIISVATDKRVSGTVPGLAIGLTVIVGVLIGGPVTGGSMNPARSFGPALFAGGDAMKYYWIYLLGPILGASLGAIVFEQIRLDRSQSKGAPDEIM